MSRKVVAAVLAAAVSFGLAGCDPNPPAERSVSFTAAGDTSMGEGAEAVLDKIKDLDPDFNVHLGDMTYEKGAEQAFCDLVTGKLGPEFPYQLVAGNHESNGLDGDIDKFVDCLPNKMPGLEGEYGRQWYVDVPQDEPLMRLIMVSPGLKFEDGELDYSRGSKRWQWTESAIDGAREANIPWTVVGMHTPCFSLGRYDCEPGQAFTNLMIEKNVDLVLHGHEHIYQRTHQLGHGRECPSMAVDTVTPGCVVDSDASLESGKGTVFVTVGLGGRDIRDVNSRDPERPYFAAWSGANKSPSLGTLAVKVTSDRMDVKFEPAEGHSFTDSFSISK